MSKSSETYLLEAEKATEKAKKECNKKALEIVESWIEQAVPQKELLKNLYFINQNHFQDIIEERAILKKCGYPLCGNVLKNIPLQKYHISTLYNKVFDITEKKNFCSNICYKAARYLKNQLLTSPLWLRDEKESMLFELLPIHELQYPELQHILELQPVNLTEDIKTLINTFKLSANNITFIPAEWNLISLIIFKLLSIKNQIMYQLLNRKIKNMNLTLLLLSYKLEESYLDKVVMWLTDIDQILKNQN
uniref:RNA polymerase II subunit B1 CTD phosphatase RPAP2 homolog n=1 Tax=Clastoptera arizonana TaxID=38151 RepID=A0A1B6DEH9_9HEMI